MPQTSLKRKHCDEGANARHTALFQRQMQQASAKLSANDAVRDQVPLLHCFAVVAGHLGIRIKGLSA